MQHSEGCIRNVRSCSLQACSTRPGPFVPATTTSACSICARHEVCSRLTVHQVTEDHRVASELRVPTMCVLVAVHADSGPVVAEASHRHNTSTQVQDIFRQKEQAKQLGYRRMRQLFGQRWHSMDLQSRQPTHGLRKLSERKMAARRISEEVGSPALQLSLSMQLGCAAYGLSVQLAAATCLARHPVCQTASRPRGGLYDAAADQQSNMPVPGCDACHSQLALAKWLLTKFHLMYAGRGRC